MFEKKVFQVIIRLMSVVWITHSCLLSSHAKANSTLKFIENKGQWPSSVLYASQVPGGMLFVEKRRLLYSFTHDPTSNHAHRHSNAKIAHRHKVDNVLNHAFEIRFINSNASVSAMGENVYETKFNYIYGSNEKDWVGNAQAYAQVYLKNIYEGVDLSIYSSGLQLKYDFIIHPKGKIKDIRLQYEGLEALMLEDNELHLVTSLNRLVEKKPYAYQMLDGGQKAVECRFKLQGNELTFELPKGYKRRETLVIDPEVVFSAYSGSTTDNWGYTATFDEQGNVYSAGIVRSTGYPVTIGAYQTTSAGGEWDIGILKFDSVGSRLLYATYLGGNSVETPHSLLVNNANELLILGTTGSSNFPVTNSTSFRGGGNITPLSQSYSSGSDLFIAKLNEDGSVLLAGTYIGGTENEGINSIEERGGFLGLNILERNPLTRNYGDQFRGDIITDREDNVYIASNTTSSDFPNINTGSTFHGGSHDAVVVKLSPDLSNIIWSRFLGGSGTDAAYSLKVSGDNSVFIAGGTESSDFEGMNGLQNEIAGDVDGWVAHVSADGGTIINATYTGTSAYDQSYFVDINLDEDVYLYGQTRGSYPISGDVYSESDGGQFILKLSNDLQSTLFSTVFGSGSNTPDISPTAFLVSECNKVYLAGWGGDLNSSDGNYIGGNTNGLTVSSDAFQVSTSGNDFYLMVLDEDASDFIYGTFLGGGISDTHVDGGTSRFDRRGIVYHAVCAGCGGSSDFPSVNAPEGHQTNAATTSSQCNNAVFKFDLAVLSASIRSNSVTLDDPGIDTVCFPNPITFENFSFGGDFYVWDLGDGTVIERQDTSSVTHIFEPGVYTVTLTAFNPETCEGTAEDQVTIFVFNPQIEFGDDADICAGDSYQLEASGGVTYFWESEDGSFSSSLSSPIVNPDDTTLYFVTVIHSSGCEVTDSIQVNVVPFPDYDFTIEKLQDCFSRPAISFSYRQDDSYDYVWDLGDSTVISESEFIHEYEKDNTYNVQLVATNEFCSFTQIIPLRVVTVRVPNVFTPNGDNANQTFFIEGPQPYDLKVVNRWGNVIYENSDYQNDWTGSNVSAGVYYYYVNIQDEITCKGWVQIVR